jgi:hypothetical protein
VAYSFVVRPSIRLNVQSIYLFVLFTCLYISLNVLSVRSYACLPLLSCPSIHKSGCPFVMSIYECFYPSSCRSFLLLCSSICRFPLLSCRFPLLICFSFCPADLYFCIAQLSVCPANLFSVLLICLSVWIICLFIYFICLYV